MRALLFVVLLVSLNAVSIAHDVHPNQRNNNTLQIDENTPSNVNYNFDFDIEDILEKSDFAILNYTLMSNRSGERWATITLQNTSSGQRILKNSYLAAIIADGSPLYPHRLNHKKLSGNEIETFVVNFGKSDFPILYLLTRN